MAYNSVFRGDLFADQVIIITGGGTGIGRCIAHELASLGAIVALGSRSIEKPQTVRAEIEAAGGKAFAGECNIRERDSVSDFVKSVLDSYGRIDGLVNNGGGQFLSPAQTISPKGWNAVIDTNLTGTWNMTQIVMNEAMEANGGAIVSIVMEHSRGFPGMAHSAAARAGVENLTKTLAVEWARMGIRVNAVAPGYIQSSGLDHYPPEVQAMMGEFAQAVPAKRFGTEAEVAGLVTFLLSPAASYITGETVWIDGGKSLWGSPFPIDHHEGWPPPFAGFDE